jgi:hydrogenase expression/formation protein HypD
MQLKYLSEFRDPEICQKLLEKIHATSRKKIRLMEICGTHTMSIARNGIRPVLPETIALLSGPGCPVCVTAPGEIDAFIKLACTPKLMVATFGDLLRVPGSVSSLEQARAAGADIRVVYSAFDCLNLAQQNPEREIVFLGVGFETTAPTIAVAILEAARLELQNFSVFSAHKLIPPALNVLLKNPAVNVDGFICPGHVSVVTGARAYLPVAQKYHRPCVVAGFEPADILLAILMLVTQLEQGIARVEIAYKRGVTFEGNAQAREVLFRVFEPTDAAWRGLGTIPASGLKIRAEFQNFDAANRFRLEVRKATEPKGCECGAILAGVKIPTDCGHFGSSCTPEHPVGPCMVSSEGTCAAHYRYLAAGAVFAEI